MSFSHEVKEELARIYEGDRSGKLAELSALMHTCGSIEIHGMKGIAARISSENAAIIKKVYMLIKDVFGFKQEVCIKRNRQLTKHNLYFITVEGENAFKIMTECGIILIAEDGSWIINNKIVDGIVDDEKRKRAYLRGAFLGCGSLNDPEKGYHMEMVVQSEEYAFSLGELLRFFELKAKIIARKNNYIVYLKEGEQIVDFLNLIGAHKALLDFENVRVFKEVRNNVNRIVNCETANLSKTVNAALKQIDNIQYIENTIGLKSLPPDLYEVAIMRLENRDLSLKELGQLLTPPLGKSGVNHRLKRIEEIAMKIKKQRGDVYIVQKDGSCEE